MSRKQHVLLVFHGIKGQLRKFGIYLVDLISSCLKRKERQKLPSKQKFTISCPSYDVLNDFFDLIGVKTGWQGIRKVKVKILNYKYNCESCSLVKFQQYNGQ